MFDFVWMEYQMEEALVRSRNYDSALEAALADLRQEQRGSSFRRRIAGAIVGFALKLDPEAITAAPRRLTLEGANVRS